MRSIGLVIEGVKSSWTLVGYVKVGSSGKYIINCSVCSLDKEVFPKGSITCNLANAKKGYWSCACSSRFQGTAYQQKVLLQRRLNKTHKNLEVVRTYKEKGYIFAELLCKVCSKDSELYPNIVVNKSSIKTGYMPCGCSKIPQWTEQQNTVRVERKALEMGYEFLGWEGKYKGNTSFPKLYNPVTGNTWSSVNLANMMNLRRGDPSLAEYGYSMSKRSSAYIVRWSDGENSYLKMGITNQQVKDRVTQQSRKTKLSPTILFTFENDDGKLVADRKSVV